MVPLQLEDLVELFVNSGEILPSSGFLFCRDRTKAVECN